MFQFRSRAFELPIFTSSVTNLIRVWIGLGYTGAGLGLAWAIGRLVNVEGKGSSDTVGSVFQYWSRGFEQGSERAGERASHERSFDL